MRLAGAIIDGMTGGLASRAKEVADGAWKMGQDAIANIAKAIDSHSPSKETHKLGQYFGDGFHLGIASLGGKVNNTAAGMGTSAVSTLKKSMSGIKSVIEADITTQPTIRPVLDLSAVKKDSAAIGSMIKPPKLTVRTSYEQASTLALQARTKDAGETAPTKGDAVPDSGTNITYNQYINSPKAISRGELYRETNNQLSKIREGKPK
jgi:hypothetical protein